MDTIRLNAETHTYFFGEKCIPGFSEICKDLGITKENPFYTESGKVEGKMLSQWLLFLAQGRTSKIEPDPRILIRVEGIKSFLSESGFKLEFGEISQYDPVLNFACTPDIVGKINGCLVNIDAKRGANLKWHVLQLAAQKIALEANGVKIEKSFNLYLKKDGGYRLLERDTKDDESRWKSFIYSYHAKRFYI